MNIRINEFSIRQTDPRLDHYINKYGCLFMSLAYGADKPFTTDKLNTLWKDGIVCGYINGDVNKDGDMDDANEAVIVNHDGVLKLMGASLRYTNKHYKPTEIIPDGYFSIGQFFNKVTNFHHFVVINRDKKVTYDPILNSNTVKNGVLESIRLYKIV